MALVRRIAYNVVFNSVAKIISTVLALVAIGYITRYLGREGFGEYSTVLAFFALFNAIADLGLASLLTREISRKDAQEEYIVGNIFTLRIVSSTIVFAGAILFVPFLPYNPSLEWGIILAATAFLFSSSSGVLNGIFQKRLAMFKVATVELIAKCIQLGIIIAAVSFDWGFSAIVSSLLVYMAFNALCIFALSRHSIPFHLSCDSTYWKSFLRESLPIGIISIVTFAYFKMDTILLSILRSSEDVGIYNVAYKIIENLIFFPAMIAGLILPLFSRYIFHEREKFQLVANKTFKVFVVFAAPLAFGGFFLADHLVSLIGGPEFQASATPLRILIFSLAAIFFGNFFNAILIAGNKQKKLLLILMFVAIFNVLSNLIVIPLYSFTGAAFISLLTETSVAILTSILVFRTIHYRPSFESIPGILLSTFFMSFFLFFFHSWPFPLLLISGALCYSIALWATGSLKTDELSTIFFRGERKKEEISPLV